MLINLIHNKSLITATFMLLMLFTFSLAGQVSGLEIDVERHSGITIDGLIGDWSGIPSETITLIRPLATSQRLTDGLELRAVYDDSNIYILVMIADDYDYNATDAHKSASVAVLFPIDEAATPDMGGGKGYVDIWHWELDTGPGILTGFNLESGNDPIGNLDDEYSFSPMDRHDDDIANELYGAWSHTNMSVVGAPGKWIFEIKRSLTTSDTLKQDRQFEANQTYKLAVAYWDADETGEPGVNNGWTAGGHYATCNDPNTLDFSWIDITLHPSSLETDVQTLQQSTDTLQQSTQNLQSTFQEHIDDLTAQLNSMTLVSYVAIGVAIVGLLIGGSALMRKRS